MKRLARAAGLSLAGFDYQRGVLAFERIRRLGKYDPEGQREVSEIRVLAGGRRSRLVARAEATVSRGGSEGTSLSDPELSGGFVYWKRTRHAGFSTGLAEDILRTPVRGGRVTSLTRAGRLWSSPHPEGGDLGLYDFTVAGEELFYGCEAVNGARIGRVAPRPPRFE